MASLAHRPSHARLLKRQALAAAIVAGAVTALTLALSNAGRSHAASVAVVSDGAATTVQQFGLALETRDFSTICDDLFTADARAAEGGSDCPSLLAANAQLLQKPRVRVTSVSVHGRQATATIAVRQQHQPLMIELIQLTREAGRFRIAAVTSPGE